MLGAANTNLRWKEYEQEVIATLDRSAGEIADELVDPAHPKARLTHYDHQPECNS